MSGTKPAYAWLPPPSVSGRYPHSPMWAALGAAADVGLLLLDTTRPARKLFNRRARTMPEISDRMPVAVAGRRLIAEDDDVVELTFAGLDGALPDWHPGAHVDVYLPSGRKRQYSLCGDPDGLGTYRVATRRIAGGGGGSLEMHALAVGDVIEISVPRNAFYLSLPGLGSGTSRLRFIAGGIGITPILPMVRLAERSGVDWELIYVGRHRRSLPFLDELGEYGDRVIVRTDDEHGPTGADDLVGGVDEGTATYVCGPPGLIEMVQAALPDEVELHSERFSPPPVVGGHTFTIELLRSREFVEVAADETALAAIRRHKPDVAYSCQQGFCGRCVQQVVDGTVDHRDRLLTDGQRSGGKMLVCVSRAEDDRLTLDL